MRCIRRARCFTAPGVNITVTSLTGKLGIGIIACRQRVADARQLADGFQAALKELPAATA